MSLLIEKLIVRLQRIIITGLMAIACPAFVVLGFYGLYETARQAISQGFEQRIGYMLALSALGIIVAWVCFRLARKGVRQMKEHGIIYRDKA